MQLEATDKLAATKPLFDNIASEYTAVITRSVPDEAPTGLESTGSQVFYAMWSLMIFLGLHTPVLNAPGFKGNHDMSIDLSLVAP
ncbi:amidase [Fusarium oxysporum f. sp. raphani 54005]|uniref:Amidase n=1 Tax=Fusarium oxysporum f. sp. raphani 54005 TaxID=1089458 RepID=X0BIT1_FUSOX|nr:amidase [Fusarium oxysporum f. sp. raphani 54005]